MAVSLVAGTMVGVFGAAIGSFLNVVIHRVPAGESIVSPPSRCPGCETAIAPYDNVPVLSWLVLRGSCRSCGTSISARYPLVELLTAVLFAVVALVNGVDERLALSLPFVAMLMAVSAIDLDHRIIPNRILAPAAVYAVAAAAVVAPGELPELLAAGGGAFAFMLATALLYPAGMGMGDVKLAGVMGLYLGVSVIPALLVAFVAGAVVGVAMLVRDGAAARKKGVPFGPFMALGGIVGLLAGVELIDQYVQNFL